MEDHESIARILKITAKQAEMGLERTEYEELTKKK